MWGERCGVLDYGSLAFTEDLGSRCGFGVQSFGYSRSAGFFSGFRVQGLSRRSSVELA